MGDFDTITDVANIRSRAAAVTADPGMIAIENIAGTLKQVNDQGAISDLGGVSAVASADGSVIVASSGGARDLSLNGVAQLVDSFGVGNDSVQLNAALVAMAARPHNNGVIEIAAGTHRLQSQVTVPTGCSVIAAGKNATTFLVDGNGFDAFKLTNPYGSRLKYFRIKAVSPRTSGAAIKIIGGNTAIQPFSGGGYTLSANETEVDQVDMDDQFDGVVVENDGSTAAAFLVYIRNGRFCGMNGGDGIRLDCPGVSAVTYGASHFIQRVFVSGTAGALAGNGLHVRGVGDFTVDSFQVANTFNGLLIDPPASGRLTTGRFSLCQFDVATAYCASIVPNASAVFGDIAFNACWFAGGGVHNVLVNATTANGIRFMNSFFYAATQYGLVITGPNKRVDVIGNHFADAGSGGFRAVGGANFNVSHNRFTKAPFGAGGSMPQAVTIDAGCTDYIVTYNDFVEATAGLLDNGGAVNKIVTPNL